MRDWQLASTWYRRRRLYGIRATLRRMRLRRFLVDNRSSCSCAAGLRACLRRHRRRRHQSRAIRDADQGRARAVHEPGLLVLPAGRRTCSTRYAERPDVIALSLPVDYLGLSRLEGHASPPTQHRAAASLRQGARRRRHLHAAGRRQRHDRRQRRDRKLRSTNAIKTTDEDARPDTRAGPLLARAQLDHHRGGRRAARASRSRRRRSGSPSCRSRRRSPIKRGENEGKTLTYTNIVREMTARRLVERQSR